MPNITPLQNDFSSGEITPELFMRPDLQIRQRRVYQSAAREVLNFWSDSRGPLRSRDGFRYIGSVLAEAAPVEDPCDYVDFAEVARTPVADTDFNNNGGISIDPNGRGIVLGGNPAEFFEYYTKPADTWILNGRIDRPDPPNEYEGFGFTVAHNTITGYLVTGCPNSDEGAGTNTGQVVIYTGNTTDGWIFHSAMLPPPGEQRDRGQFGDAIAMSGDGQVLAIGAPGTDGDPGQSTQSVFIYDFNGSGFTYRNNIQEIGPPTDRDTGFGDALELNADGSVLIVGDSRHGLGATGEVTVWDDTGSGWSKRQTIQRVVLADESLPGRWVPDSNNSYWGKAVNLSDDAGALYIGAEWNDTFANNAAWPCHFVYKLNTDTNLYEFCILQYQAPSSGIVGVTLSNSSEAIFNATTKKAFFVTESTTGTSRGMVVEYDMTL